MQGELGVFPCSSLTVEDVAIVTQNYLPCNVGWP